MYVLGPCGSLQRPLLGGWEFLMLSPQPPTGVFSQWFEALFPRAGALDCVVCLALPVYLHINAGLPSPTAAALPQVLSTRLPISAPPTSLDECLFFNSWLSDFHTVQFSVSSGCFLFLNLLSFFWLCEEAQCVYLRLHLGWKSCCSS